MTKPDPETLKLRPEIAARLYGMVGELSTAANNETTGTIDHDALIDLAAHIQDSLIRRGQWSPKIARQALPVRVLDSGPSIAVPRDLYDRLLERARRHGELADDIAAEFIEAGLNRQ